MADTTVRPGRTGSLVAMVFALFLAVGLAGQFAFVTPRFERIFADFNTKLPHVTQFILVSRHWLWLAGPFIVVVLVVKELVPNKRATLWVNVGAILAMLACSAIHVAAMYLPLIKLIKTVSGP